MPGGGAVWKLWSGKLELGLQFVNLRWGKFVRSRKLIPSGVKVFFKWANCQQLCSETEKWGSELRSQVKLSKSWESCAEVCFKSANQNPWNWHENEAGERTWELLEMKCPDSRAATLEYHIHFVGPGNSFVFSVFLLQFYWPGYISFGKKVLIFISTSFTAQYWLFFSYNSDMWWAIIEHNNSTKNEKICSHFKVHTKQLESGFKTCPFD